jgi:hypothetical protein
MRRCIALLFAALVGCHAGADPRLATDASRPSAEMGATEAQPAPSMAPQPSAHHGAAVSVQLAQVEVVGGDVPDATSVAATMVPQFRACQMRWAPRARGEVQVSAKVGPSGEVRMATPSVSAAEPDATDELPGMLVSCIGSEVARGQFATPSGNDPVVVIHLYFAAL